MIQYTLPFERTLDNTLLDIYNCIVMPNIGKKHYKFKYTHEDIASLTGLKMETVRRYAWLGKFNPDDLESVVDFVNKYRKP